MRFNSGKSIEMPNGKEQAPGISRRTTPSGWRTISKPFSATVRVLVNQPALLSVFILFLTTLSSCTTSSPQPPNIIVMLIDDAGYADFDFMAPGDLQTPNIDRLANQGMIFTDAHVSASVCGPSRAGLLTGKYQQRFGYECNPPATGVGLPGAEVTLAEALKERGYKTAAIGKWHLGDLPGMVPTAQGFDYTYTFLAGHRQYFPSDRDDAPGSRKRIIENGKHVTFEGYLTDVLGEKAADFIQAHGENPFFLYWAPNAVHTPMQATEEDLARFENHPRQALAAMTWSLDRAVGKITQKLEEEGLLENTLIFFLSDNGGATNNQSSNGPLNGFKGNEFEGGHRVAFFVHWPGTIVKPSRFPGLTSSLDIYATSLEVSGVQELPSGMDGVSLLPFLKGEKQGHPHEKLFWRKDHMAAVRVFNHKLIRVDSLGHRLYDLENDLGERNDLGALNSTKTAELLKELASWEVDKMEPLWEEGALWDEITWLIHQDLFENKTPQVTNPRQLREMKNKQKE